MGWGEEIFLEVTGKQAPWHTPSWRALRSAAGRGCQLGHGGEQGTPTAGLSGAGDKTGILEPRSWERREGSHSSPSGTAPRHRHARAGAPSKSIQPPPKAGTPVLPDLPHPVPDSRGNRGRR